MFDKRSPLFTRVFFWLWYSYGIGAAVVVSVTALGYVGPMRKGLHSRWTIVWLGAVVIGAGALNGRLMYDDLYLVEHFRLVAGENSLARTLLIFLFSLDLGPREYRLYGASKILHFALFYIGGSQGWFYGGIIAASQFLSGLGLRRLLPQIGADRTQAVMALVWIVSPFAVTTCFHHYSYSLLPYQLTIACALALIAERRWTAALLALLIANTGEAYLPAAALTLVLATLAAQKKLADLALLLGVMLVSILLHRIVWSHLLVPGGPQRFAFAPQSLSVILSRLGAVLAGTARGISEQVRPILALSGPWLAGTAAVSYVLVAPVSLPPGQTDRGQTC